MLEFVSILFLIFEKGISKETVPGILRFVSMLFNIWKRELAKNCAKICKYSFFLIFEKGIKVCRYAFLFI